MTIPIILIIAALDEDMILPAMTEDVACSEVNLKMVDNDVR